MKKAYSAFLFLFIFSFMSYSQTGTIKIAKPPAAKKDTVIPKKSPSLLNISIGGNYTFKKINKVGYDAEVLFIHGYYIGIKYSHEIEYYKLSPYNKETLLAQTAYPKSENQFDYLKIPIGVSSFMTFGTMKKEYNTKILLSIGLAPEYLLKANNQYSRLSINDFNRFNLAGNITIGLPVFKHYSINVSYSKDFFNNLKDKNIYDETGVIVGKQKSKTNLISLSVSYRIYQYR